MKTLHLDLVYSVPDGSNIPFVKLVNAFSDVLNLELLDLHYLDVRQYDSCLKHSHEY